MSTFARNALHDVMFGWDERAGALCRGAVSEVRLLPQLIGGRTSWREASAEARRISRDALERARSSREAGSRAYPFAASAGGLLPQVALAVLSGGLFATPIAQGAMAASKSLAESPENLTTLKGLKTAVPRAGVAGGSALVLAKGAQVLQRGLSPVAEYLGTKVSRLRLGRVRRIVRAAKALVRSCEVARK